MNIDRPQKIYASREEALADGAREDQIVTGTHTAIRKLQSKLLAATKRKRARTNGRRGARG